MVNELFLPSISALYKPRLKSWDCASAILLTTIGIVVEVVVVVTGIVVVVDIVEVVVLEII